MPSTEVMCILYQALQGQRYFRELCNDEVQGGHFQCLMYAELSTLGTLHKTIYCIRPAPCIMLEVNFVEFTY